MRVMLQSQQKPDNWSVGIVPRFCEAVELVPDRWGVL